MTSPVAPARQLLALAPLVGLWNTDGKVVDGDGGPVIKLHATDAYEWLPGGHFLLHRVDARMGEAVSRSIEIYRFNASRGTVVSQSYDDQGTISEYLAAMTDRRWSILGRDLRFDGEFDRAGTVLAGRWERQGPDGTWARFMDIRLTKST